MTISKFLEITQSYNINYGYWYSMATPEVAYGDYSILYKSSESCIANDTLFSQRKGYRINLNDS